ncbi:hypothetical protein GCM10022267_34700 [Lentzea roselyniae]|uniref:Uncharacterized protein n=1 Tax=Lentzea roselyniae TaxID=531940 RepID=A0ABP7B0P0_9PSEU
MRRTFGDSQVGRVSRGRVNVEVEGMVSDQPVVLRPGSAGGAGGWIKNEEERRAHARRAQRQWVAVALVGAARLAYGGGEGSR